MFKFKITLDRHIGIQNLIYSLLPDPPLFSLPSTFKDEKWWGCFGYPEAVLVIRICIRIRRIRLFWGLPDSHLDLFVSTDPYPAIIKQK
jgi:hypothetical protein